MACSTPPFCQGACGSQEGLDAEGMEVVMPGELGAIVEDDGLAAVGGQGGEEAGQGLSDRGGGRGREAGECGGRNDGTLT